jgi:carbamoyltransferase
MKKILGISAFYHDSASSLVIGGQVISAAQEERFTREKHTSRFPVNAIKYCLEEGGLELDDLDAVIFYDKPLLKFERLLETYYSFAPRGLKSFLMSMAVWISEKLFLKKQIYNGLLEVGSYQKRRLNLLFSEHHLSHAASAFYPSGFKEAAILTVDAVGEWSTCSIGRGDGASITFFKEMNFPHSVGLLYSAFTYYLGFTVNSGEYKLMGLAPYGNPNSPQTLEFERLIKSNIVKINTDGSIWMDQKYFNYATGLRMVNEKKWEELFGFARRSPESELRQDHCNLALAIQRVTEEIIQLLVVEAKRLTGSENLCLAGGVALNCVANGKVLKSGLFKNLFIQPASGDAGGALGAALAGSHIFYNEPRHFVENSDLMRGSYLGPDYSNKEVELMFRKAQAVYSKFDLFDSLTSLIAQKIADGHVVGWFQGRMEFGPRALGNRSVLGDARNPEMQKRLNIKIKYREGFRPFAPAVLEEDIDKFFDLETVSPYMLLVAPVKTELRSSLPANYDELPLWDKLYYQRSTVQSITHLDFSARIQSVHKETNPRFWHLISRFKEIAGIGLVVNTSFNVRGEPIVCTPMDAYRCFMSTDMDYLVINDYVLYKQEQPDWQNKEKWQRVFKLD